MKPIKILFVSHIYPGTPAKENPYDGVFIKELLKGYPNNARIYLIIPVDIIPGLKEPLKTKGIKNKFRHIKNDMKRLVFTDLKKIQLPVHGEFVRYISVPFKSIFPFLPGAALFVRLLIRLSLTGFKDKYDLIHAHTAMPDGLAAVLLGKIFKLPVLITIHGSDVHSVRKTVLHKYMLTYVLRASNKITCVSKDLKKRILSFGVNDSNIFIVKNGISNEFLNSEIFDVRKRHGIDQNKFIFISVMRLIEIKDPITLLKAFEMISKATDNVHLIIVGDGHLKKPIGDFIEKRKLNKHVTLTGNIPHHEIPSYMASSNVFCLSSLMEGFPTVIFEAMAFGTPIVATNVGGVPEAIKSEEYGFLVPANNHIALADAMGKSISKKWDSKRIETYAKENLWGNIADDYVSIYKGIIKRD